jgi:hypothetical protein
LRASGVISSHFDRATGSEMRAFRKSAGTLCTAPEESALLIMDFILHGYAISWGSPRMSELRRRVTFPITALSGASRTVSLNQPRLFLFESTSSRIVALQMQRVSEDPVQYRGGREVLGEVHFRAQQGPQLRSLGQPLPALK